jgi:hypothetical protein
MGSIRNPHCEGAGIVTSLSEVAQSSATPAIVGDSCVTNREGCST